MSVAGGPTTWVAWDATNFPYLTTLRWSNGGPPLICVQRRDQTEIALLRVDPSTGKTATLLTETDPTWVNIHQDVPRWLADGSGFLWISERDGGPQLQLHNPDGRRRHVLVPASAGFQNLVAILGEGKDAELIYSASTDPTQAQLFRLRLSVWSEPQKLTTAGGLHSGVFAKSANIWVHTARTLASMPTTTVLQADGTPIGELPSVAVHEPVEPRVELLEVGKDRTFHAAVVWPRNFDSGKKYPVIVDVYGGPHHLQVQATRSRWLLDQWYADQGFIVVALDGRGTPGRGHDWERAIYKKFGSVPLEDQVAGLEALAKRYPAHGFAARRHRRLVVWRIHGGAGDHAAARYIQGRRRRGTGDGLARLRYPLHRALPGRASQRRGAYQTSSMLTYAANLKRPLLLLHGTADDNVYFRHSLRLVDTLFRHGKSFEMVPLSGLTHMVPDPVVMENLHARIAGFFRKHLGQPE